MVFFDQQGLGGADADSSSFSSIVSRAPTERNLRSIVHSGNIRASSSKGSLTPASSLSDLLAYEQIHIESQSDPRMQKPLVEFEAELRSSRPAFLNILKGVGLNKLSDRQRVANALSALLKERADQCDAQEWQSHVVDVRHLGFGTPPPTARPSFPPELAPQGEPTVITPGDPHLWFTPFNWLVSPTAIGGEPGAIAVCPGAYLRLDWEGEYGAPLALVIDSSSASDSFISIACSRDDGPLERVLLPHGQSHATVELPPLHASDPPEPAASGGGRTRHRLWVCLDSSKQKLDRWGDVGILPACSLRIRRVLLPPGATPVPPRLRPLRMLAFGDSIVEGVAAEYQPGQMGDLKNNASHKSFVACAARRLDAEYSSVGYGRQGWTVPANGNVPPFANAMGVGSWERLWVGAPRQFAATGGPHVDLVVVNLGTCDGLIAGPPCAANVRLAVAAFLPLLRAAVGPTTKIFLCVPFGGFGGNFQPPVGALYSGYHQYMSGGIPSTTKKQMEKHPTDPLTFYLQFGKETAHNLDGFKVDSAGMVKSSRESYDGVHPLSARHAELADVLVERIHATLKGAPVASEPVAISQAEPAMSSQAERVAEAAPSTAVVGSVAAHEKEKQDLPLQQMIKSVGGLFKRALTEPDCRGGGLLDGCGLPPASKPDTKVEDDTYGWPETPDDVALAKSRSVEISAQ
mmetsp:Transcript_38717/g.93988  ORF Transcript_38717/g.93988 Transcript_38717/m.93988 type:complete len:689 (+) Transcript_38717:48-2114(+)